VLAQPEIATVIDGKKLSPTENAGVAESAKRLAVKRALKHVSAIFDEIQVMAIAESAQFIDRLRETEVVSNKNGFRAGRDSCFEFGEVRFAAAADRIELNVGAENFKGFHGRTAKICGQKDMSAGRNAKGLQAVKNGIARPKER
jgi:hypothetical protein